MLRDRIKRFGEATRPERPTIMHGRFAGNDRVVVDLPGGGYISAFASDRSLTPTLLANGMYDEPFWRFIHSGAIREGDRVVDVGANIGLFTLGFARNVGDTGRVYAVEPDQDLLGLTRENCRANHVSHRVSFLPIGASDRTGEDKFTVDPAMRMLGSVGGHAHGAGTGSEATVPVDRLDRLVEGPLRYVKIDVEGGEAAVVRGMTGLLDANAVELLDLEVIRNNAADWNGMVDVMRDLASRGGVPHEITGRGTLQPIELDTVIALAGHWTHIVFRFRD